MTLPPDFTYELRKSIQGEVRDDLTTRILYSTDASIYTIEPMGVVFPRALDELSAILEISARHRVPVLARGSGSSLAGQAIGPALIIDCTRFLNQIEAIDPESASAVVQPGVILAGFNKAAGQYGLQFGPDPASAERATLGGSIANNATGAHSILYGMAADHVLSVDVVLSDGSLARFEPVTIDEAYRRFASGKLAPGEFAPGKPAPTLEAEIYRAALGIRDHYEPEIRLRWPRTWRRASGYNLNYLLPWSSTTPPLWHSGWNTARLPYPPERDGMLNIAPLVAGSEGTLAVIRRATLRLVPRPVHTVLVLLAFATTAQACDAAPDLLELRPSAVELLPRSITRLALSLPAYASHISVLDPLKDDSGQIPDLLIVEFSGENQTELSEQARQLGPKALVVELPDWQKKVWTIRKVGLGILQSRPGDTKAISVIEDLAVPVEHLGQFVREMERILAEHGTEGEFYAHASAGCLHIRPLVNLKTGQGVHQLREIASAAVSLTLSLEGAVSGEHGDGIARGEWLEPAFGQRIMEACRTLKAAADPHDLLNPGKIVSANPSLPRPKMDESLRYGPGYQASGWQPVFDFTRQGGAGGEGGLLGAIEQCNGAGVCRKSDGVMCPSFQATQEEMHSTRGRANLLRAMASGRFRAAASLPAASLPTNSLGEKAVKEALDLCLACKGCKSECPSGVDMARLKYEFFHEYYRSGQGRRLWRDYLFGYIDRLGWLGQPFAWLANPIIGSRLFAFIGEKLLGLSSRRAFPHLAPRSLRGEIRRSGLLGKNSGERVLFLGDAFGEYFQPQASMDALRVLKLAGCRVELVPVMGAGRTLISKAFLQAAKAHAAKVLEAIHKLDPDGQAAVVGVEPSEIYTLREEYLDFFPDDPHLKRLAEQIGARAFMIDEFLLRPGPSGSPRLGSIISSSTTGRNVLLHGHCYQKAQPPAPDGYPTGVAATIAMLKAVGCTVEVIESGCCGMAGAFGYEAEHYDVSMKVGEQALFPAIRACGEDWIVAASGVSCQAQIEDGAERKPMHPVSLLINDQLL